MVRKPYIDKNGVKKGAWSEEEDDKLRKYILRYGHWNWRLLPKYAGLERCGKSCRLRWINYLKPGLKLGKFTDEEAELIEKLHDELGNKWTVIAAKLPGRTDNEVKNYWHTHIKKNTTKSKAKPVTLENQSSVITENTQNGELENSYGAKVYESPNIISNEDVDSTCTDAFWGLGTDYVVSNQDISSCLSDDDKFTGYDASFWMEPHFVDTFLCEEQYYHLPSLLDEQFYFDHLENAYDDFVLDLF